MRAGARLAGRFDVEGEMGEVLGVEEGADGLFDTDDPVVAVSRKFKTSCRNAAMQLCCKYEIND